MPQIRDIDGQIYDKWVKYANYNFVQHLGLILIDFEKLYFYFLKVFFSD